MVDRCRRGDGYRGGPYRDVEWPSPRPGNLLGDDLFSIVVLPDFGRSDLAMGKERDRHLCGLGAPAAHVRFALVCRANRSAAAPRLAVEGACRDRKSTRLNSSHLVISYAVFCL